MPPKKKGDAGERFPLIGRIGTNLKVSNALLSFKPFQFSGEETMNRACDLQNNLNSVTVVK